MTRYHARMPIIRADTHLQESIETIVRLLERHRVLEALAQRHEGPRRELVEQLQRRQNLVELQRHLGGMHPADIAHVLEALPLDDRRTAWEQLDAESAAGAFVEVSEAVRSSLVENTPHERLVEVLVRLDPEDLAYVSPPLAPELLAEVLRARGALPAQMDHVYVVDVAPHPAWKRPAPGTARVGPRHAHRGGDA